MKILVLVESPGKINKIQKILGNDYIVRASVGHIRMLDPKNMSIDLDNNFTPNYIIDPKKKKVVNELKIILKQCNLVLLAADEDREGEAIAQSLVEELKLTNYKRILFNEITKTAILNAVNNPGEINKDMVDSQKCRMILDKIVGYKLCPLLWQNIENKLSAGRVQSVVVKLLIDREEEIKKFNENSFYKIQGIFDNELKANLHKITKKQKNKLIGEIYKHNKIDDIKSLLESFKTSQFKVLFTFTKEGTRNPSPPFITSSLQQEASSKLGYNVKRTMSIAQKLYEKGLITYMRTDSTNLSKDALRDCKIYIEGKFGVEYYQERTYSKKSKNAQEAHEAIRPTTIAREKISNLLDEEIKLYNLIWKQTVASQMASAKVNTIYIQISISNQKKYYFESSLEEIIFLGFLKLFGQEITKVENIPNKTDSLTYKKITANQEFTKSIGRYNESSLVKTLEKNGIGRPSTFAGIISKIQDKDYAIIKNIDGEKKNVINFTLKNNKLEELKKEISIGSEKKKFIPTDIGYKVTEYLNRNFEDVMDYKFTAEMENKLDDIASNKLNWIDMLKTFYNPFNEKVVALSNNSNQVEDRLLGKINNCDVFVGRTKYGDVVKMIKNGKTKYATIVDKDRDDITLDDAKELLKFPVNLGEYNDNEVILNNGQYGLFLKYNNKNYACSKEVNLKEAIEIITTINKKSIKTIKDKDIIYYINNGQYGPYISYKKNNKYVNKPIRNIDPKNITIKDIKKIIK